MSEKHLRGWMRGAALAAAVAVPLTAAAQQAYTRTSLNLRAGPGTSYPIVAQLAPGVSVDVQGCLDGYNWCDVTLPDGLRGWVASNYLDFAYQGTAVPLVSYGALIGVPVVSFAIGAYWGSYYRDRPWYHEPRWWGGRRPPPPTPGWRPPPPPAPGWQPRPPPPSGWRPPPPRPPGMGWQSSPPRPPGMGARPPGPRPPGAGASTPRPRPPSPGVRPAGPPGSASGLRPPRSPGVQPPPSRDFRAPASPGVRPPAPTRVRPPGDGGMRPPGPRPGGRPGGGGPGPRMGPGGRM